MKFHSTLEVSMLTHQPQGMAATAFRPERLLYIWCGIAVLVVLCLGAASAEIDHAQEILREKIKQHRYVKTLKIGEASVASTIVVPDFYERREFRLAWEKRSSVDDLFRAIRDSEADGLDPRDYHLGTLEQLRREVDASSTPTPTLRADFDILLTDALVRLGYHLMFGKVDPERLDPAWNMSREIIGFEPAVIIQRALDSDAVYQAIDKEKPKHPFYTDLKAALGQYRVIKAAGGWPQIPAGPTLKLGMRDERIPSLRRRLITTGDLAPMASESAQVFDSALAQAVKVFQRGHGLTADGAVGPGTLAALNVPVDERIQQLRVNLERGRWLLHHLGSTFIVVNVAGYHAHYVKDGQMLWQGRAQVGKPYRQTPTFKAEMAYVVFNPTWTVPPTILTKDYLPGLKRDPGYAQRKGLKVIDRAGRVIDPGQVDWSRYSTSHSPYLLRQDAGPRNALGRVKFIFPNDHTIFLHDTPNQTLFDKNARAFSSGCIRVENAMDLAHLLLNNGGGWNRKAIDRVIESGKTRTVFLHEPIPVLLLYWTAWVDSDGRVNFRHDLYDRDKFVQKGLANDFRFRKRPVIGVLPYKYPFAPLQGWDVE
jgi:murein L,D-transpeptidase YcbB/YkuD